MLGEMAERLRWLDDRCRHYEQRIGARSALRVAQRRRDQRSVWACRLKLRRGPNVAAVALANKNVRVMWAMLTRGEDYRSPAAA